MYSNTITGIETSHFHDSIFKLRQCLTTSDSNSAVDPPQHGQNDRICIAYSFTCLSYERNDIKWINAKASQKKECKYSVEEEPTWVAASVSGGASGLRKPPFHRVARICTFSRHLASHNTFYDIPQRSPDNLSLRRVGAAVCRGPCMAVSYFLRCHRLFHRLPYCQKYL